MAVNGGHAGTRKGPQLGPRKKAAPSQNERCMKISFSPAITAFGGLRALPAGPTPPAATPLNLHPDLFWTRFRPQVWIRSKSGQNRSGTLSLRVARLATVLSHKCDMNSLLKDDQIVRENRLPVHWPLLFATQEIRGLSWCGKCKLGTWRIALAASTRQHNPLQITRTSNLEKSLGVHKILVRKIWFYPPPPKRAQNEAKL